MCLINELVRSILIENLTAMPVRNLTNGNMSLAKLTDKPFPITQKFGKKLVLKWVDIYKQSWLKWHNWIDYGMPEATILLATIEWTIEVVNQKKSWYGLYIKIFKKRENWITEVIYGHLYSTLLKTGDKVKVWQFIWFSWGDPRDENSWTSTWPHLHFWLRFRDLNNKIINENNGYKGWVDPMPYFQV